MKIVILLLTLLVVVGCASSTPQANRLLNNLKTQNIPMSSKIEGVPFIQQKKDHCGPATLTMAMNWSGKKLDVDEVAKNSFTPLANGTFQLDMIATARAHGLLAIPISSMENLLKELAAKNPVIVFENLAFNWYPQWHYAIVHGYNLKNEVIYMHSGEEKNKEWDIRKFERSWKHGEYWGLIVLPPSKLSATAKEIDHMRAAAAIEKLGKISEAKSTYKAILNKWPKSYMAMIGLGNIAFNQNKYSRAKFYYENATNIDPNNTVSKHNLEIAKSRMK